MRICIYGAGAIGGLLGARLAKAGAEVSPGRARAASGRDARARPDPALGRGELHRPARPPPTTRPSSARRTTSIVTLKAHQVPGVVGPMQPLLGPDTAVVMGVNGVPWWYFHGLGGPYEGRRLRQRRPRRRAVGRHRAGAGDRLRRLPGGRGGRARRDRARRGRPLHPGRALGRDGPSASSAWPQALIAAGLKAPVRAKHPRRDLGQALGQPLLQPDQRADRRHARRDLRRPRHARAGPRDDGRGAGHRREAGRALPDPGRQADRRCGRRSARTRPRCCRTSSAAGRWRSTRWSPRSRRWAAWSRCRRRRSTPCWRWCVQRARLAGCY